MNNLMLNILVCPKCKTPIELIDNDYLLCTFCKEKFVIINNIPVFIARSNINITTKNDIDPVIQYHLRELQTAYDPNDPRHIMPHFKKSHITILDIGCGIGQTFYASKIYNDKQKTLLGIDIKLDLLIYGHHQYPNIKFINASGDNLPIQSEEIDFVISRVSLPYTNIPQSIKEIYRVLKSDGEIWITLHPFKMLLKHFLKSCIHLAWKDVIFRSYVIFNGFYFHFFGKLLPFPIKKNYESFQTAKAMARLLEENGFSNITIEKEKHFLITAKKKNV